MSRINACHVERARSTPITSLKSWEQIHQKKIKKHNSFFVLTLVLPIILITISQDANAGSIIVGKPGNKVAVNDDYIILVKGDPSPTKFEIKITPGLTAAQKADAIVKAINAKHPAKPAKIDPLNSARVEIDGSVVSQHGKMKTKIRSKQKTRYASLNLDLPNEAVAVVGFDDLLAGVDPDGAESVFDASFGFDGLLANSSLSFGNLSGSTLDDLLTDTYIELLADLPLLLQANLSLDLSDDLIRFQWPTGESNYFIDTFTSDASGTAILGMNSIPEPATGFLVILGILGLILTHRRSYQAGVRQHT